MIVVFNGHVIFAEKSRSTELGHLEYLYNPITHQRNHNPKCDRDWSPRLPSPREELIKSGWPSHHGVDPVCWGVLAVFDSQFDDAFSLQQTRAGAHGKTPHLLHTGDEEIHPAQNNHNTFLLEVLKHSKVFINDPVNHSEQEEPGLSPKGVVFTLSFSAIEWWLGEHVLLCDRIWKKPEVCIILL